MRCRQGTLAIGQSGKENVNVDSTALRPLPRFLRRDSGCAPLVRRILRHLAGRLQPEPATWDPPACRTSFRDDIEAERHAQITEPASMRSVNVASLYTSPTSFKRIG